jgi:hypothetical protein
MAINMVELMVDGDADACGHEVEVSEYEWVLSTRFDSGQGQALTDIKKLLQYMSNEHPAEYMKFVSNDMMIAYT